MKSTEKKIKDFMVERGWNNLPPDGLAKSISIEAGELLELFQWDPKTVKEIKADAVMEMDADFQHPPRFVKPMVEAYLNVADYCIGSRYIKGCSVPKEWALFRKAVSFFGNLFIRLVLLNP